MELQKEEDLGRNWTDVEVKGEERKERRMEEEKEERKKKKETGRKDRRKVEGLSF